MVAAEPSVPEQMQRPRRSRTAPARESESARRMSVVSPFPAGAKAARWVTEKASLDDDSSDGPYFSRVVVAQPVPPTPTTHRPGVLGLGRRLLYRLEKLLSQFRAMYSTASGRDKTCALIQYVALFRAEVLKIVIERTDMNIPLHVVERWQGAIAVNDNVEDTVSKARKVFRLGKFMGEMDKLRVVLRTAKDPVTKWVSALMHVFAFGYFFLDNAAFALAVAIKSHYGHKPVSAKARLARFKDWRNICSALRISLALFGHGRSLSYDLGKLEEVRARAAGISRKLSAYAEAAEVGRAFDASAAAVGKAKTGARGVGGGGAAGKGRAARAKLGKLGDRDGEGRVRGSNSNSNSNSSGDSLGVGTLARLPRKARVNPVGQDIALKQELAKLRSRARKYTRMVQKHTLVLVRSVCNAGILLIRFGLLVPVFGKWSEVAVGIFGAVSAAAGVRQNWPREAIVDDGKK